MAIENLKGARPELYQQMFARQEFIAESKDGQARGFLRSNESSGDLEFQVQTRLEADGSLVLPTPDARRRLPEMMRKERFTPAEIEAAVKKFDESPVNTRITLAAGFDVIKRSLTGVGPALDGRSLLVRREAEGGEVLQGAGIALLTIAYEYLALHIRSSIFSPRFDPIREH